MPIKSNQPKFPVIYQMFNHDDTVKLVPWKEDTLNLGDTDMFHKGTFKLKILLDEGIFLKVCIFDDDVVYQDSDSFVVNPGTVEINGKVANLYYS